MRKSLGAKRRELAPEHIDEITRLFSGCVEADLVTLLDGEGKEMGREGMFEGLRGLTENLIPDCAGFSFVFKARQ